jgi:hypothetical protein
VSEFVQLDSVSKVYQGGITGALNNVSLAIEQGEFRALGSAHQRGSGAARRVTDLEGVQGKELAESHAATGPWGCSISCRSRALGETATAVPPLDYCQGRRLELATEADRMPGRARPPEFKAFRPGGQPSPTAFPVCKISPRRMTLITLMRVSGLANPAFLLEVEAVAAMPE